MKFVLDRFSMKYIGIFLIFVSIMANISPYLSDGFKGNESTEGLDRLKADIDSDDDDSGWFESVADTVLKPLKNTYNFLIDILGAIPILSDILDSVVETNDYTSNSHPIVHGIFGVFVTMMILIIAKMFDVGL